MAYDSRVDTLAHIRNVQRYLQVVIMELMAREEFHDRTKLSPEEKPLFDKYTPLLRDTTYGSDRYKQFLAEMQPALKHHYAENRHHPEHFENGIHDMTLVDILEMLCDWKAATLRHADGDIQKSIEINQKRFGYSDELKWILLNTVKMIEGNNG